MDRYAQTLEDGSETVLSYAKTKKGYRSVDTAAGSTRITSLSGGPVLGLFASGNMTPKYAAARRYAAPGRRLADHALPARRPRHPARRSRR